MKKIVIIISSVFFVLLFTLLGYNYFKKLFLNYNDKIEGTTTYIKVPVANGDIETNTVLLNEHIIFKDFNSNDISDDVITNFSILIGKTTKNDINNGYYFTYNDIYE